MSLFGDDEVSDAQDSSESTGSDEQTMDSNESESESDEFSDDSFEDEQASDSVDDESEEAQDDDEDDQEEEPADLKNQNGAFDWKKISAKLGPIGSQLEKSFKEAQRTTGVALQDKAKLEKQLNEERVQAQELTQQAQLLQEFNRIYESNPKVQQAINEALQGGGYGQHQGAPNGAHGLPPGVDPNDPLVPLLMQQQQVVNQLANQHRQQEQLRRQHQERESFRQGLTSARDTFTSILGRPPTQAELQLVADKMRQSKLLDGSLLVPSLFVEDIRKAAKRDFFKSRDEKKRLPKRSKSSVRPSNTSERRSLRDSFDKAWAEHD